MDGGNRMKKRTNRTLYPEKEDISIQNFLLENKQLVILIIIIVLFSLFIIGCLLCIPYFQGEHVYNAIGRV